MRCCCLLVAVAVFVSGAARAWGPHTEIAQAALDALGRDDALIQTLGPDAPRLAQYVWMADQRQQLVIRSDEVFYADDFLLFPDAPKHYQHICPEVEGTYVPYFRRALQALRTESTRNAARWIGSLMHFTTDTGSPPHALGILGPTHSKMENWLDAKLIHVPGYKPQLLGKDDAEAEAGFLHRMAGLIAYSKERALRCKADVEADQRPPVEPVVLECALETARVTADLLHTLGVLSKGPDGGDDVTLSGMVIRPVLKEDALSRLPAKVLLLGTKYSTLTEPDGSFAFRHLPAEVYQVVVSAPGGVSEVQTLTLGSGASEVIKPVDLSKEANGNLVRNAGLKLRWVTPDLYDQWSQPKRPAQMVGNHPIRDWEGEWIRLTPDVAYELSVRWKRGATSQSDALVFVRTKGKADSGAPVTESSAATPTSSKVTFTATKEAAWAQVCIRTAGAPDGGLEEVSLRRE